MSSRDEDGAGSSERVLFCPAHGYRLFFKGFGVRSASSGVHSRSAGSMLGGLLVCALPEKSAPISLKYLSSPLLFELGDGELDRWVFSSSRAINRSRLMSELVEQKLDGMVLRSLCALMQNGRVLLDGAEV